MADAARVDAHQHFWSLGEVDYPWLTQSDYAAIHVCAKVSGLNTAADPDHWLAEDLRPFIEVAMEQFGSQRLMFGSDWPVCLMAGDYQRVWEERLRALEGQPAPARNAVLGGSAAAIYGLTL